MLTGTSHVVVRTAVGAVLGIAVARLATWSLPRSNTRSRLLRRREVRP